MLLACSWECFSRSSCCAVTESSAGDPGQADPLLSLWAAWPRTATGLGCSCSGGAGTWGPAWHSLTWRGRVGCSCPIHVLLLLGARHSLLQRAGKHSSPSGGERGGITGKARYRCRMFSGPWIRTFKSWNPSAGIQLLLGHQRGHSSTWAHGESHLETYP